MKEEDYMVIGIVLFFLCIMFIVCISLINSEKACKEVGMEYNGENCIKEENGRAVVYSLEPTAESLGLKFKVNKFPSIPD
jgi:hypothetical protein